MTEKPGQKLDDKSSYKDQRDQGKKTFVKELARISGDSRVQTAVEVSQKYYDESDRAIVQTLLQLLP